MMLIMLLLFLVTIPNTFGANKSLGPSIDEFVNNVMIEEGEIRDLIRTKRERTCIIRVLELYSPKCEENDQFDKRIPALELTRCIFETNQEMPPLPTVCIDTPLNIDKCVAFLANDGVLWTTYFGYLNFLETLCSYYESDLASIKLWEDYNAVLRKLCQAVSSFDHVRTTQVELLHFKLAEVVSVVDDLLRKVHKEVGEHRRDLQRLKDENLHYIKTHRSMLQQDVTEMKAWINQEQLKIVQLLSLRMEKLGNEVESAHLHSIGLVQHRMENILKTTSVSTLSTFGILLSAITALLLSLLRFNFFIIIGSMLGIYYGIALDVTSVLYHLIAT